MESNQQSNRSFNPSIMSSASSQNNQDNQSNFSSQLINYNRAMTLLDGSLHFFQKNEEKMRKKIDEKRKINISLANEVENLRNKIVEKDKKLDCMESKIIDKNNKIDDLEIQSKNIIQLNERISYLKNSLKEKDDKLLDLKKENGGLKEKIYKEKKEISSLKWKVVVLESEYKKIGGNLNKINFSINFDNQNKGKKRSHEGRDSSISSKIFKKEDAINLRSRRSRSVD
jgi:chromosome segregation ATPase